MAIILEHSHDDDNDDENDDRMSFRTLNKINVMNKIGRKFSIEFRTEDRKWVNLFIYLHDATNEFE